MANLVYRISVPAPDFHRRPRYWVELWAFMPSDSQIQVRLGGWYRAIQRLPK